jgi:hypothetical protein
MVEPTHAGFLPDYESLQPIRGWGSPGRTLLHLRSDISWWRYGSVVVEPIQVRLVESSEDDLNEGQVDELIGWYEQALSAHLPPELERLDHPREDSVVVRAAITEADRTSILFSLLTTLVLLPLDTGGATMEIELRDGGTSESLALFVNADQGYPWNFLAGLSPIGHARQSVAESARWIGRTLTAAVKGRPIEPK